MPIWYKRDYESAHDKTKYFACDTGLMSSILNWNDTVRRLDKTIKYHYFGVCVKSRDKSKELVRDSEL